MRSPIVNRRTVLCLIGSALATVYVPAHLGRPAALTLDNLPGSLSVLSFDQDVLRQARRRMQASSRNPRLYQAAQDYLRFPADPVVQERFEQHARQDFIAGRVTVVGGWLVSETELAWLASIKGVQED